jgi:hypothetical protein
MLRLLPMRMKVRSERLDDRERKSMTDKALPRRAMPRIDIELPSRANVRKEKAEPRVTKSSTDNELPNRARPYIDIV